MRWDGQLIDETAPPGLAGPAREAGCDPQAALFGKDIVARTFDTPGFRGMTFYEVYAKSIINKVPPASRMPFQFTINPYRGCGHACVYCFARNTHTYLDLDAGLDFNSKIIVKVNAAELARKELARPRWSGEHVAMGTNVDCYQRAEGRYRLMPGIIAALRDARNPFSILTKGTLLLRDLDLLADAAQVTSVALNMSVGFADTELSASVERGASTWHLVVTNRGRHLAHGIDLEEDGAPGRMLIEDSGFSLMPGEARSLDIEWRDVPPAERRLRISAWNAAELHLE